MGIDGEYSQLTLFLVLIVPVSMKRTAVKDKTTTSKLTRFSMLEEKENFFLAFLRKYRQLSSCV